MGMDGDLDQDRRWLRLHDRAWTCPCCGESHGGLRDVACHAPDFWDGGEKRPNADLLSATHILTEDFCIVDGEHFFVRGVLELPILGAPDRSFGYGAWASLSAQDFEIYRSSFDSGEQGDLEQRASYRTRTVAL